MLQSPFILGGAVGTALPSPGRCLLFWGTLFSSLFFGCVQGLGVYWIWRLGLLKGEPQSLDCAGACQWTARKFVGVSFCPECP